MHVSALKKEKVKESQSRNVTPSLDTPSGAGLGASQFRIMGTNEDDEMSFNARNAGSRFLQREGDRFTWGLLGWG